MRLTYRSQVSCVPCQDPRLGWDGRGCNRTHIQNSNSTMKLEYAVIHSKGVFQLRDNLLKFTSVDHLPDDIKATHEFSFDNELRKRWPVIEGL
jgi:hypothetical protein